MEIDNFNNFYVSCTFISYSYIVRIFYSVLLCLKDINKKRQQQQKTINILLTEVSVRIKIVIKAITSEIIYDRNILSITKNTQII